MKRGERVKRESEERRDREKKNPFEGIVWNIYN